MNDLEKIRLEKDRFGVSTQYTDSKIISYLIIAVLLYVDYTILVSDNYKYLHKTLNVFRDYCQKMKAPPPIYLKLELALLNDNTCW